MPHGQTGFDSIVHAHVIVREATSLAARSADPVAVERALRALAEVLPEHFHAEEKVGGYFEHIATRLLGNGASKVAALVAEHRIIEHDLAEILGASVHDDAWVERGKRIATRLQEHERVEAHLGAATIPTY